MTPENDATRPAQDPGQQPEKSKSTLAAINESAVGQKANQALKSVTGRRKRSSEIRLLRT
nr:inner membrane protein YhjD [Raoultella sp. NCTC 9187]